MDKHGMCEQPDREVPGIKCGYPIPCPWHTVIMDTTKDPPELTVPATRRLKRGEVERLQAIALASVE